jgi:dGTPase
LASIVKYPFSSDLAGNKRKFGFFHSEVADYERIAQELGILKLPAPDGAVHYVRHPLVYLVEAADDICYQIMDIEDAHKLKILTTEETRRLFLAYFPPEQQRHIEERMMQLVDDINEQIVYLRSCVINCLEQQCVRVFIQNEHSILSGTFQGSLIKHIDDLPRSAYEQCKKIAIRKIYHCKDVVDIELAGYKVITTLTDLMVQAVTHSDRAFSQLLINRVSTQYDILAPTLYERIMAVLDYISGMTDVFALDLYRKINGMSLPDV